MLAATQPGQRPLGATSSAIGNLIAEVAVLEVGVAAASQAPISTWMSCANGMRGRWEFRLRLLKLHA